VRNHVKLLNCNHRLKAASSAVESAPTHGRRDCHGQDGTLGIPSDKTGSSDNVRVYNTRHKAACSDRSTLGTYCEMASGREEVRVCNTRHKETSPVSQSFHSEASTDEEESTAVMSADDAELDWRRLTDGHMMAKKLKNIEQEETEHRRTGMRPACRHGEWKKELEKAMTSTAATPVYQASDCDAGTPATAVTPVYQASAFDSGTTRLRYEDFTSQAQYNFRRDRRPVFRNHSPLAYSSSVQPPFFIQPTPIDPAKLDGLAYTRASPTFIRARINNLKPRPTVGLLDNCAAISLIDRKLLMTMEPPPERYDGEVNIKGIGSSKSSEFCVMPIFIDVTEKEDGIRRKRKVRIRVEFHIIDNLNESFVLGMDIIGPYQIDIITSLAEARIQTAGRAAFPLSFGPGVTKNSLQQSYHVVAAETITIPGQPRTTVPALIASHPYTQSARYDLFLDPVPIWDDGLDMLGMVGKGLYSSDTSKVWFANLGSHPITIRKGMRIASASHVSSMDTISVLPIKHTAGGPGKAEIFSCVPKKVSNRDTLTKMKAEHEPHWSIHVQQYAFPAYPHGANGSSSARGNDTEQRNLRRLQRLRREQQEHHAEGAARQHHRLHPRRTSWEGTRHRAGTRHR
jgi:hypothetical protein